MNKIRVFHRGASGMALLLTAALAHAAPQTKAPVVAPTISAADVVQGSDEFSQPQKQQEPWASEPGQAQPLSNAISQGFDQASHEFQVGKMKMDVMKTDMRPMQTQASQWYARPPDLQAGPTFNGVGGVR